MERMGDRLRWCRRQHGWTQRELAAVSGVGLATIRRIEQDESKPRLDTARRLAETLHVREGWIAFGESPMLDLGHMATEVQHRVQSGPGTAGMPGYVIVGSGPWFIDDEGEWQVAGTEVQAKPALGKHDN
jgi:transcriptional regulator with XRE-family HTH domain